MAGWLEPIGPQPPRVYWIRRVLVLLAILAVVGVVWGIVGALHPAAKPTPTPASKPPTAPAQPTSAPATSSAPATPAPAPATTVTPTPPAGPTPCDAARISAKVTGAQSVKSGDSTKITMTLTNDSGVDCILDVNPKTARLVITSGDVQIWSTTDCDQWLGISQRDTVAAGKSVEWSTDWNTHRSTSGCNLTGEYLQPGTYVARLAYADRAQGSLVMVLHG